MKKLKRFILLYAVIAATAGFFGCSNSLLLNKNNTSEEGYGTVSFNIIDDINDLEGARTVTPKTGYSWEFSNVVVSYSDTYSKANSGQGIVIAQQVSSLSLTDKFVAIPSGTHYFNITCERYGTTFTQTKLVTVEAGKNLTVTFDSLTTSGYTGKIDITIYFPSSIKGEIQSVKALYKESYYTSCEDYIEYNATNNNARFTKENVYASNYSSVKFTAYDSNNNQIFVYPVIVNVKAGYCSSDTIDLRTTESVTKDSSKMVSVTYKVNDSSSSAADFVQEYYPGKSILSASDAGFSVDGKKFTKWTTNKYGSGTEYNAGATPDLSADLTLYAIWVDGATKIITYNSNYPYYASETASTSTDNAQTTFTVKTLDGANINAPKGYKFTGWNSKADGTGLSYNAGTEYQIDADRTLYAQWTPFTVTYKYNGGAYAEDDWSKNLDNSKKQGYETIPEAFITEKYSYYTFLGWSYNDDSKNAMFKTGDSVEITEDTTFYAVWKLGTLIEDESTITVPSDTSIASSFTLLNVETLDLQMYASGSAGLDFYIYDTDNQRYVYTFDGVTTTQNKTLVLVPGNYKLIVHNGNILKSKQAKRVLKPAE